MTNVTEAVNDDAAALQSPFLATLVQILHAEDSYGAWEGKSDARILRFCRQQGRAPRHPDHGRP